MALFEHQWATYRSVVRHDLMEHRALAAATAAALEGWLARRPAGSPAPAMADLGCGDLALLAPLLQRLPLGSYTCLDLTAAVLPLAQAALGPVPYPTHWQQGDLLAWIEADGPPLDLLHSAFAIHHLSDGEKSQFLAAARRRLAPGGLLLWADVFRQPGEALAAYRQRYGARVGGWQPLSGEQRAQVIEHLSSFDIPAERGAIEALAEAAGWRWQWAWQGQHRAEALAVLTPA
ncbi:MAG: class I SAM-dependent methyltransferase [Cyanobium sp. M30B3]|nr:MAG: class I SAM-dependent methyltransferase [Cyanobium sp. M30B3]